MAKSSKTTARRRTRFITKDTGISMFYIAIAGGKYSCNQHHPVDENSLQLQHESCVSTDASRLSSHVYSTVLQYTIALATTIQYTSSCGSCSHVCSDYCPTGPIFQLFGVYCIQYRNPEEATEEGPGQHSSRLKPTAPRERRVIKRRSEQPFPLRA